MKAVNDLRYTIPKFTSSEWRAFKKSPLESMAFYIKYRRVYIPKTITKDRPLGVPALPWRVYLKMFLIPLNILINVGEFQHGAVPGRGTLTAFDQITSRIYPARNVWEIDFKGFFPSVQPESVLNMFTQMNMPEYVKDWFKRNNESRPI
jgi:hypothetical protein